MTQRMNFYSLFRLNPDGSIEPLRLIRMGGVQFGPGVRFGRGVMFSGVDLTQFIGRDFEVEMQDNLVIIVGIYNYGQ